MEYIIVGLGNPGEEYARTRHNVGRMVLESLAKRWDLSDWRDDKKLRAKMSQGKVGDQKVICILPDNYMNRSGGSVEPLVTNKKQAEHLIVVHDDIDLGLGTIRIVFNRGSGGHRGVESIEKALKTRAYFRVRVGVVPTTPSGKLKKPIGEEKVYDFILKKLSKKDGEVLDAIVKKVSDAVETFVMHGHEHAMRVHNAHGVTEKKKVVKKTKKLLK
jgi:PTH1 family peptidyl-tRNA hydrolase